MAKTDGKRPVHLVYTREDDIKGGRYRPMFYHAIEAALDPKGGVAAWKHRLVGQSFMKGTAFEPVMFRRAWMPRRSRASPTCPMPSPTSSSIARCALARPHPVVALGRPQPHGPRPSR